MFEFCMINTENRKLVQSHCTVVGILYGYALGVTVLMMIMSVQIIRFQRNPSNAILVHHGVDRSAN